MVIYHRIASWVGLGEELYRLVLSCRHMLRWTQERQRSLAKQVMVDVDSTGVRWRARPRAIFQRYFPLLLVLWILFVLYPNPLKLVVGVRRVFTPDVNPYAVEAMMSGLPSAPAAIEEAIIAKIPYRYDWEVHGIPWYFPTIDEVLQKGEGDCKARAIVLASVFEAANIPYRLNSSPIHIWVEYEGKVETSLENSAASFYQVDPETGKKLFQFPDIGLDEVVDSNWQALWEPMPGGRRCLLLSGIFVLVAARIILSRKNEGENWSPSG